MIVQDFDCVPVFFKILSQLAYDIFLLEQILQARCQLLISVRQLLPQKGELLEKGDNLIGHNSAYFRRFALVNPNAVSDGLRLQIALFFFLVLLQSCYLAVQVLDLVFVLLDCDNGHSSGLCLRIFSFCFVQDGARPNCVGIRIL